MHQLIVRHITDKGAARFAVVRASDQRSASAVTLVAPAEFAVEGNPGEHLAGGLRWYLEEFLDYPFPPRTERAERIRLALGAWGRQAFRALFGRGRAHAIYEEATSVGVTNLSLDIQSEDPRILAWPWEALEDEAGTCLGLAGQMTRRLDSRVENAPLSGNLPRDRINVLLIIARPFEQEMPNRSSSRPLVDLALEQELPMHIEVLRPPTFARLKRVLAERRGQFHALHFDGHAGHGAPISAPNGSGSSRPKPMPGQLVFEAEDGDPDPVPAAELSALLVEHEVPLVVLHACQAGTVRRPDEAFAAAAAALSLGGVLNVVASGYSLYVSGARPFLPAFYRELFATGNVRRAVRAGRQKMFEEPGRVCAVGTYQLADWLVPVAYQQAHREDRPDFRFAPAASSMSEDSVPLPDEAEDAGNPYGLIGRDAAMSALERAMDAEPAAVLLGGVAGIGKTTLARGFVKWLASTGGLDFAGWINFSDVRSAESVVNRMAEPLFGTEVLAAPIEQKIDAMAMTLREQEAVIVWDNFESARGIEGTATRALLPPEDLRWIKQILEKLRGGKTKILLTSRTDEGWLGALHCTPVPLLGLKGEERWDFCARVLRDLGLSAYQQDASLVDLLETLSGHPLAIRAVLPRLKWMPGASVVAEIVARLEATVPLIADIDDKLAAALGFIEDGLGEDVRPLLTPLALHERFLDVDDFLAMAETVPGEWTADRVRGLLAALTVSGLTTGRGPKQYELHPALTAYLRSRENVDPLRTAWEKAFVDRMARVADRFMPKKLPEQRATFLLHQANFDHALSLAPTVGAPAHVRALTQSLGIYAQKTHALAEAERLYQKLAADGELVGEAGQQAAAYHQLGMIALERRDLEAAEKWYLASLGINEQLGGNEHRTASTYHQLGTIAQQRRRFEEAQSWYEKALAIDEKLGHEDATAVAYHQLGNVALERREFESANSYYLKSLAISEKQGNEQRAASTYHQLGRVAKERDDLEAAESFYLKSIAIKETQGNEYDAALTYDRLGILRSLRDDFEGAAGWLLRAAQTFSRFQDAGRIDLATRQFRLLLSRAPAALQPRLQSTWQEAGLPPLADHA